MHIKIAPMIVSLKPISLNEEETSELKSICEIYELNFDSIYFDEDSGYIAISPMKLSGGYAHIYEYGTFDIDEAHYTITKEAEDNIWKATNEIKQSKTLKNLAETWFSDLRIRMTTID